MTAFASSPSRGFPSRNPNPLRSQVSRNRQRLVLMMQRLCFGSIHNLKVSSGEPVLDPLPRVVRRRKNGGANQPRPQESASDFVLKREVVEFLQDLDAIGDGTILIIEVAHGLPIIHEFEDVIPV
jgi:hypothetical protein